MNYFRISPDIPYYLKIVENQEKKRFPAKESLLRHVGYEVN